MEASYFDLYARYTSGTEVPRFFHRWAAVIGLGAWLGRNFYFPFGHDKIAPNLYAMFLGTPGTRKSTAIKMQKRTLLHAGYQNFAADKTTKEKFLLDLAEKSQSDDIDLFEELTSTTPVDCFIAPDEFGDFFGSTAVLEFLSTLGVLWDYPEEIYESRVKNSQSVKIYAPTISMLTGNTPTTFATMIPPEAIGQGFFSRLLLIHAEKTDIKIPFPKPPDQVLLGQICTHLNEIKAKVFGEATLTPEAKDLVEKIYCEWPGISDVRFESYANRRFTQLIKLCLIFAASRLSTEISASDVIEANSLLSVTEFKMPKALGEFGKGKNSDVVHKAMTFIEASISPVSVKDLYKQLARDLNKITEVQDIVNGLIAAERILQVEGGYIPKRKDSAKLLDNSFVDLTNFTEEEIYK